MVGGAVAHPAAASACPGVLCQETGRESRLFGKQAFFMSACFGGFPQKPFHPRPGSHPAGRFFVWKA